LECAVAPSLLASLHQFDAVAPQSLAKVLAIYRARLVAVTEEAQEKPEGRGGYIGDALNEGAPRGA
jgi:hypothetical protein